ncbi:hypothetical protein BDW22DRAFT_90624 [Trametopsis cervina]|nr:hypothetical protein BDW22DRAFT_90624 [Trametopsis cervina]
MRKSQLRGPGGEAALWYVRVHHNQPVSFQRVKVLHCTSRCPCTLAFCDLRERAEDRPSIVHPEARSYPEDWTCNTTTRCSYCTSNTREPFQGDTYFQQNNNPCAATSIFHTIPNPPQCPEMIPTLVVIGPPWLCRSARRNRGGPMSPWYQTGCSGQCDPRIG